MLWSINKMGKRIDSNEIAELFNFYLDNNTKTKFFKILMENECEGQAAAALRTLIKLYNENIELQKYVCKNINDNIVYRKSGKASKL